jgi:hypothetical protein
MLTAFLSFAAEHAEHVEPDKTVFYIAGGALAVWAVILSVIGMTQPDFPKNDGATRGVMGIGVILTIATMITVLATP